jgi:hypothetical protein
MADAIKLAQDFLINSHLAGTGWGYAALNPQAYPEPTCYSLLALYGTSFSPSDTLTWLAGLVQENGQLLLPGDDMPNWATSILIITLTRLDQLPEVRTSSINWLLEWKSQTSDDAGVIKLDPTLVGWPWISDTFSWVQPTGFGALALKLSGLKTHERVKEAESLLLDRMCLQGGWNYGNPVVLGSELSPEVVDTAIALFGLQDLPEAADAIEKGLVVLEELTPERPSALALALSILCFQVFDRPTGKFVDLLLKRQEPDGSWRQMVWWTSLAALALQAVDGGKNAFKI